MAMTDEELAAKKFEEEKRHNKKTEKLSVITGLIGALGRAFPRGSFKLNDYSWYGTPDADLAALGEKISYADPLGLSDAHAHTSACILEWIPTLGPGELDGNKLLLHDLHASLTDGFRILRRNNVSTSAFTPGEYALYHFGKQMIANCIMEVMRAIALSNSKISNLNKGNPFGLAAALRIDWNDFVQYRAEIVNRLNGLIARFNSFADMPETNLGKRYKLLCTSIIKDHAKSHKNQFYAYTMVMSYKLKVEDSALVPVKWNYYDRIDFETGSLKLIKAGDWLDIIDDMLLEFENSTTTQTINGNISRAIGDKGYYINEITDNGDNLECNIVEHDEVLCQIQNSDFINPAEDFADESASSNSNWQLKLDTPGTSLIYPNGRKIDPAPGNDYDNFNGYISEVDSSYTGVIQPVALENVSAYDSNVDLITSYETNPSKEVSTVITRNKVVTKGGHLTSVDSVALIGKRYAIYTNGRGYGDTQNSSSTQLPLVYFDRLSSKVQIQAGLNNVGLMLGLSLIQAIRSQFDWIPWYAYSDEDDTNYSESAIERIHYAIRNCEIDTFASVTRHLYLALNSSCFKNEVALSDIPAPAKTGL